MENINRASYHTYLGVKNCKASTIFPLMARHLFQDVTNNTWMSDTYLPPRRMKSLRLIILVGESFGEIFRVIAST